MSSAAFKDQAAGLRQWAGERAAAAPEDNAGGVASRRCGGAAVSSSATRTLMVVGLPDDDTARVHRLLDQWQQRGQAWVGDPASWRVVPLAVDSPHLTILAAQQTRWALWVERDGDAFRRSYRLLRRLSERGGPRGLLLMHPQPGSARGLLNNLHQAAAEFLGIRLLMVRDREPSP